MIGDLSSFDDIIDDEKIVPFFGLRLLLGFDENGEQRIIVDRAGEVESTTLIGVLEILQLRLFREFTS
jgi:hypothetical protein